ncbi:MAG TPA: bifunctional nuclease family protein [Verrucomicrobiae bacterium]|nr:bifunctional nuclease family protein [Verrucomicrobiae bacterium]
MRQMKVDKLGIDLLTHDPLVILKDLDGSHYLPILIGPFEATAIALALEGAPVPRPLSHDLMRSIIETLDGKLEQVVIHDMREATFFAKLIVRIDGKLEEIDARPSDGIALALRTQSPIYVTDRIVLEDAGSQTPHADDVDVHKFKKFLDDLKPSDFNH